MAWHRLSSITWWLSVAVLIGHGKASPISRVHCGDNLVQVSIEFETAFVGVVSGRGSILASCAASGNGGRSVLLLLPLTEPAAAQCGIVKSADFNSVIIDVQYHPAVQSVWDVAFFVQCATSTSTLIGASHLDSRNTLQYADVAFYEDNQMVNRAAAGIRYQIKVALPDPSLFHVGSCVAFGGEDTITYLPLTDRHGCAISDLITTFQTDLAASTSSAELEMFRFNGSRRLLVQCMLHQCDAAACAQRNQTCGLMEANQLAHAAAIGFDNQATFSAVPISVDDRQQLASLSQRLPCQFSSDPGLILLTLLLVVLMCLFSLTCLLAMANCPFQTGSNMTASQQLCLLWFGVRRLVKTVTERIADILETTDSSGGGSVSAEPPLQSRLQFSRVSGELEQNGVIKEIYEGKLIIDPASLKWSADSGVESTSSVYRAQNAAKSSARKQINYQNFVVAFEGDTTLDKPSFDSTAAKQHLAAAIRTARSGVNDSLRAFYEAPNKLLSAIYSKPDKQPRKPFSDSTATSSSEQSRGTLAHRRTTPTVEAVNELLNQAELHLRHSIALSQANLLQQLDDQSDQRQPSLANCQRSATQTSNAAPADLNPSASECDTLDKKCSARSSSYKKYDLFLKAYKTDNKVGDNPLSS